MHGIIGTSTLTSAPSTTISTAVVASAPTNTRTIRAAAPAAAAGAAATPTESDQSASSCERFVHANENNMTFFSPLDPRSSVNTYPPKIDCTLKLEGTNNK